MYYLKDRANAQLIWESGTPPEVGESVKFEYITFGCYNAENSVILDLPQIADFAPSKYLHLNGNVVMNPEYVPEVPPLPSSKRFEDVVQTYLNGVAISLGFDSIYTLVLRSGYPGPWQLMAQTMGTWMDACWMAVRARLQAVQDGTMPIPTDEELLAVLPPVPSFTPEGEQLS